MGLVTGSLPDKNRILAKSMEDATTPLNHSPKSNTVINLHLCTICKWHWRITAINSIQAISTLNDIVHWNSFLSIRQSIATESFHINLYLPLQKPNATHLVVFDLYKPSMTSIKLYSRSAPIDPIKHYQIYLIVNTTSKPTSWIISRKAHECNHLESLHRVYTPIMLLSVNNHPYSRMSITISHTNAKPLT